MSFNIGTEGGFSDFSIQTNIFFLFQTQAAIHVTPISPQTTQNQGENGIATGDVRRNETQPESDSESETESGSVSQSDSESDEEQGLGIKVIGFYSNVF